MVGGREIVMNTNIERLVWERPMLSRMDAADAKSGNLHHTDQFNFRRNTGS